MSAYSTLVRAVDKIHHAEEQKLTAIRHAIQEAITANELDGEREQSRLMDKRNPNWDRVAQEVNYTRDIRAQLTCRQDFVAFWLRTPLLQCFQRISNAAAPWLGLKRWVRARSHLLSEVFLPALSSGCSREARARASVTWDLNSVHPVLHNSQRSKSLAHPALRRPL